MRELRGLVILSAAKDPAAADTISGPELQSLKGRAFSRGAQAAPTNGGFRGRGKTQSCPGFWAASCYCFWVAQRFTAAMTGLSSTSALAAEGRSIPPLDFPRNVLSRLGDLPSKQ